MSLEPERNREHSARRLLRCLRIIGILELRGPTCTDDLAESLGVSDRQIRKDMAVLEDAGLPIYRTERGERGGVGGWALLPHAAPKLCRRLADPQGMGVLRVAS